ncbi:hypothetical protein GUJ93_ZPchr0007g3956 [Zizania palustris]|uniref:Uncharacterized protein n=1 Tax=Zizania palustris TaxID=103762 RepID=A0A8J5TCM8_ZIZPA|nr:hypothetical protein GUJ93_ZPchr0007g3956 [Zizania palustris]
MDVSSTCVHSVVEDDGGGVSREPVDWSGLQIVEGPDDYDKDIPIEEDIICQLLGMANEDDINETDVIENETTIVHTDWADVLVDEVILDGVQPSYDMEHPEIIVGTIYPSMDLFRLAIRQYAINQEFVLAKSLIVVDLLAIVKPMVVLGE